MDKSRDLGARPEVQARLDAMKTAGWLVGRTWGFSLGTGLVNSPVGQVVADPTKILETAPGDSIPCSVQRLLGKSLSRTLHQQKTCPLGSHIWQCWAGVLTIVT